MTTAKRGINLFELFGGQPQQPTIGRKSLTEVFNKFAADALNDFPKLRESFMFIDGRTGDAIGDIEPKKLYVSAQDLALNIAQRDAGGYADTNFFDKKNNPLLVKDGEVYTIRFNQQMDVSKDPEKDIMFTLEHELGHAVVPDAIGFNVNYDESAADIFGLLKHIKRYGDDGFDTLVARTRAANMLAGDVEHFTNASIEDFIAQKGTLDIRNMTPEQMTQKAQEIAGKNQYTHETMRDMQNLKRKTMESLSRRAQMQGFRPEFTDFLKQIASELCSDKVYASEFKSGMAFLKPFMRDVPGYPLPRGLEGQEWDMLKRSLQEKAQTVRPAPVQSEGEKPRLKKAFPLPGERAQQQQHAPQQGYYPPPAQPRWGW